MNIKLHELIVPEVKKVGVYAIRNKRTNKYYVFCALLLSTWIIDN